MNADAQERYAALKAHALHMPDELSVGDLQETQFAQQPSSIFSLRRQALERQVFLVQRGFSGSLSIVSCSSSKKVL